MQRVMPVRTIIFVKYAQPFLLQVDLVDVLAHLKEFCGTFVLKYGFEITCIFLGYKRKDKTELNTCDNKTTAQYYSKKEKV